MPSKSETYVAEIERKAREFCEDHFDRPTELQVSAITTQMLVGSGRARRELENTRD